MPKDINEIPGFDSLPETDPETDASLDALLKEATDASEAEGEDHNASDKSNSKPTDETNVDHPLDSNPEAKEEPKVEPKVEAKEEPKVEPEVEAKPAEKDDLDAVETPKNLRPKSSEAFETIKRIAREKVAASEKRASELEARVKEFEGKKVGEPSPEILKELEELRTFRKQMDVQSDPEFNKFDKLVDEHTESIYKKLLANGATEATVAKIRELGGPGQIDWEPILSKMSPVARRAVETKLVEIEETAERKAKAIEEAKKNADEFLKTRATQTAGQRKEAHARAVATLGSLRKEFSWLTPKTVDPKAKDQAAEKAAVEAHNALVKESEQYLAEALSDDSPEMRATVAMAGPELFKARAELASYKASTEKQIAKLGADLKEANELLSKIKKGSTTRLRDTSADAKAKVIPEDETGEQALDRLAAEVTA